MCPCSHRPRKLHPAPSPPLVNPSGSNMNIQARIRQRGIFDTKSSAQPTLMWQPPPSAAPGSLATFLPLSSPRNNCNKCNTCNMRNICNMPTNFAKPGMAELKSFDNPRKAVLGEYHLIVATWDVGRTDVGRCFWPSCQVVSCKLRGCVITRNYIFSRHLNKSIGVAAAFCHLADCFLPPTGNRQRTSA